VLSQCVHCNIYCNCIHQYIYCNYIRPYRASEGRGPGIVTSAVATRGLSQSVSIGPAHGLSRNIMPATCEIPM
jgi:hypothetical protein